MTKYLPATGKIALFILVCIATVNLNAQTFSWAKQFGTAGTETTGNANSVDANGNIVSWIGFTGIMDFDPGPNVFNLNSANGPSVLLKLSPTGAFLSAIQYNLPAGYVFINDAGEFLITNKFSGTIDLDPGPGTHSITSEGYNDIYVSKLDPTGNLIWGSRIGGPGSDLPNGIICNQQGDIFIYGNFGYVGTTGLSTEVDFDPDPVDEFILNSSGSNNNGFILSLDANGDFRWAQKQNAQIRDIDNYSNLYLWGPVDETPIDNNSTYISKIGSDGKKIWSRYISNTVLQIGAISANDAGEVLISGGFSGSVFVGAYNISASTVQDPFYTKLNANGDVVFARSMKTNGFVYDIQFDSYGNIYFTGRFTSSGNIDFDPGPGIVTLNCKGNWAAFIEKLNNAGSLIWVKQIGGEAKSQIYGTKIAIANNGDVYTSLRFKGTLDFDPGAGKALLTSKGTWDFVLHKLIQPNSGARELPLTKQPTPNNILVYPNPTKGHFYLDVPVVGEKGKLDLFDNNGVLIYSKQFNGIYPQKLHVNISTKAKGSYLIKISGDIYSYSGQVQVL